jgi:hypothetical protein
VHSLSVAQFSPCHSIASICSISLLLSLTHLFSSPPSFLLQYVSRSQTIEGEGSPARVFLMLGRELQCKCGPPGLWASAEQSSREFYGVSCIVVMILWRMLGGNGLISEGGKIIHILWMIHFLQAYPKEDHAWAMAGRLGGANDCKPHSKYVWEFIYAIADAELIMASCLMLNANGIVF